jgi:glycerol-3-phosphate acyltransferase PlsX
MEVALMMRIVLDAMGSDTHPDPEIEAAVQAARQWGDPVLLAGPEQILRPRLATTEVGSDQVVVVHAPEVLEMTDKPADTARGKARSSMAVGMDLLKTGEADAFVTAGNTGGAMANALFRLGRIRGVKRPALTGVFPVRNGQAVLLDIGANADCKPEYLLQFAILGSLYAETVFGWPSPRVALISNGEEAGKGNMLVKEAFPLLQGAGLNFVGNIEPKEFFAGEADVAVCDGFTGNVLLKTSEAVAGFLIAIIREQIKAGPLTSIGGLLAKPAFQRVGVTLDSSEYGAAPLLGVDGLVFVGHGRSNAKALVSAIRVARQAVSGGLLPAMRREIQRRLTEAGGVPVAT